MYYIKRQTFTACRVSVYLTMSITFVFTPKNDEARPSVFKVITDEGLGMFSTCPWDCHENIKDVFQLPWQSQMSEDPTVREN